MYIFFSLLLSGTFRTVRKNQANLFVNKGENQLGAINSDLLVISRSSTCFGRLYAHHQEVGLRFTACGFCPIVAVVMLESRVKRSPTS